MSGTKMCRKFQLNNLKQSLFLTLLICFLLSFENTLAACGGTVRTWDGSSNQQWSKAANWSGNNVPDSSSEDAIIVSGARPTKINGDSTVACLEVTSGSLRSRTGTRTLTVTGDYFKAITPNNIIFTAGHNPTINMAGTGAQEFSVVDPVETVVISNNTVTTFTDSFEIRTDLNFTGSSGGTLIIKEDVLLSFTGDFTIPAGITLRILSGGSLTTSGSLIVNGTLEVAAGGSLKMADSSTLIIANAGFLNLDGAAGNVSTITGNGSVSWGFNMAGTLAARYFRVDRVNASGMNITGTVNSMDDGEFHYIANAGTAMTWGAAASIPSTIDNISFFDDDAHGNNLSITVNASYTGNVDLTNWAGIGCAIENCSFESDPNNLADWGGTAETVLTLSTNNNTAKPADPVTAGDGADEFAIFSFALNQSDTSTDITSITFTLIGSGMASDVDYIRVFKQGGSCQTVGAQIGGNIIMSGTPAKATVSLAPSDLRVSNADPKCIHVHLKTTASAENNATIGLRIENTADVVNSAGYAFSGTSGPPVSAPTATISGDATRLWRGKNNTKWRANANWYNGSYPRITNNCSIGVGTRILVLTEDEACQNTILISGGEINFANSFDISVSGSLSVDSGFIFTNAANSNFEMSGTSNQTLDISTVFPGNLIINNTGGSSSTISVNSNSEITGDLTIQDGTLSISNGSILTVGGDIDISNGAVLDIQAGGILKLGDGSVLTVDSGGKLEAVGTGSLSVITADGSNAYTIVINGIISAQNYSFSNLGTNGVTVNSGATINASNFFQNGTFTKPINNNTKFLRLFTEIPGDTLTNIAFQSGGSSATGVKSIFTNVPGSIDTLSVTSFSGDLAGTGTEDVISYAVTWAGESNSYKVTSEASSAASAGQGETISLGRFGFQQNAGAGFTSTNITSLKLTLDGTGDANDIDSLRIYEDTNCDGLAGTLIGSGTFSGSPASKTFSGLSVSIPADVSSPAKRCIYIQADIASDAVNSHTVGVKIVSGSDITNDQAYTIDASAAPPISLGTASVTGTTTTWVGSINGVWTTAGNWSGGLPTTSLNCIIPNVGTAPTLSGTGNCKSLTITSGNLTISGGSNLNISGTFNNSGALTNSGTINFIDNGTSTTQHIISPGGAIGSIAINKTLGGNVYTSTSTITASSINLNAGNTSTFRISGGKNLISTGGIIVSGGRFEVNGAGTIKIASGQSILVNGGDFYITGSADAAPQNPGNKGLIQNNGSGTWGFNSTSGNVSLNGFLFEDMNPSGLQISGSSNLLLLNGGQFKDLSNSYASVRAIQFNTTGTIPTTANNIGWNFLSTPANTDGYKIISSSGAGCGSSTIDFDYWFGDWYENVDTFDVTTKISEVNCTVNLNGSTSAINLKEFTATGYNGKINIEWETTLEQDHLGFNVYRSDASGTEFVKINLAMIRNINSAYQGRGRYRLIDTGLTNDTKYYYYLEDIQTNGIFEMHGPKTAIPTFDAGDPSGGDADINEGDDGDIDEDVTADPSRIPNPSYKDLGNGIIVLSQTSNSMRLWVIPGVLNITDSNWDANYEQVTIDGYSKIEKVGAPELLERVVLVEVHKWAQTADLIDSSLHNETTLASHLIAPAPAWTADANNTLRPSYSLDSSIYTNNSFINNEYFSINPDLISFGDKKYLKVTINPLKHNPVTSEIKRFDQLVIDISFDGNDWNISNPERDIEVAPEAITNTLKIGIDKTGVYEISYDDLVDSNVESPFMDLDINNLRLYNGAEEVSLEVNSIDDIFNSGDTLRFFTKYTKSLEDKMNYLVLSSVDLLGHGDAALRFEDIDGDISLSNGVNPEETIRQSVELEENYEEYFDAPLGDSVDHFFWKRIFGPYPTSPNMERLDVNLPLNNIDITSNDTVKVSVHVKGRWANGDTSVDVIHNLEVYINDLSAAVDNKVFGDEEIHILEFNIPAYKFLIGDNLLRLRATGNFVPAGMIDMIFIDKVKVEYDGFRYTESDTLLFNNYDRDTVTEASGFSSSSISVYDITSNDAIGKLSNTLITTPDTGVSYNVAFNSSYGTSAIGGLRYYVFENGQVLSAKTLELNKGHEYLLKEHENRADFLIIGPQELLAEVEDLVDLRESQGIRTKRISLAQIYNEFSGGKKSSEAVKEFIQYAQSSWDERSSLKYILFLGDATYDIKDHNGFEREDNLLPMPLVKGSQYDFGSDNWFVSSFEASDDTPTLAIGRIPTSEPEKLKAYINKLIAYEENKRAPLQAKKLSFLSDSDSSDSDVSLKEGFSEKSNTLAALDSLSANGLNSESFNRSELGSDLATNQKFIELFNAAPLLMNYMGHGAENIMAAESVFDLEDARSLSNNKLPIFLALNCLSTGFYSADPEEKTIGEELLLNPSGGSVSFIGSSAMTTPTAQMNFAKSFYNLLGQNLGQGVKEVRIGDLFHQAKLSLANSAYHRDVQNSYILFGDPTMLIPKSAFSEKEKVIKTPANPPTGGASSGGGGGGCSVLAADGAGSPYSLLNSFGFLLLLLGFRCFRRKIVLK